MPRQPTPRSMTFLHAIFSPRGGIEGAMVEIDGQRSQLVFQAAPALEGAMATLVEGDDFEAHIEPLPPGGKGVAVHPVHELISLAGDAYPHAGDGAVRSAGQVVRLNYARHGEPNGVVLDNGDFVHLRPDGYRQAGLAVGDRVEASGEARALHVGSGRVIEAAQVNGIDIPKPKPKAGPHGDKPGGPGKPKRPPPDRQER